MRNNFPGPQHVSSTRWLQDLSQWIARDSPSSKHPDHVAAAAICRVALYLGGRVIGQDGFRPPARIYAYDNGPGHTIGFVPDTFVDISDQWQNAATWIGEIAAAFVNESYDPAANYANQRSKEILAAYRGLTCGTAYAEAFRAARPQPTDAL